MNQCRNHRKFTWTIHLQFSIRLEALSWTLFTHFILLVQVHVVL